MSTNISSRPNSKLLLVQLWTPSSSCSSFGVTDLDVLSTDLFMNGMAPGCLHRNMTSREPMIEDWRSRRHLTLPVLESSSVSLTFDLEARGCGVQNYKVARGHAYQYFFQSRHHDVNSTTITSSELPSEIYTSDGKVAVDGAPSHVPKKTYRKVSYRFYWLPYYADQFSLHAFL